MTQEVAIRITADGRAVVAAAQQSNQALQGISTQAERTAASLNTTTHSSVGLSAAMQQLDKLAQANGLKSHVADLDRVGISAKQTANALRGVPAQFTDIVTSLQGGQAPLTVFLQQGGQLKDMFGGAGNAAKALGGYVMSLINPFTVGAAVVGGLAFAYEKGAKESRAFQNAATLSGNAVSLSASQFGAMTQSLSEMAGTRGKAAEALTEIAATGKLAGSEIKNIAEAAILMEKATGQAIEKTVAEFVKLADEPVKASLALNKQYNYLTAAIYEQIKALEDQGNKLGAAELAEKSYADALKTRAVSVINNAGLMERAWNGITGAAKGAWDAMLGVGRQASLADKLATVSAEIDKGRGPFNPSAFGDGNAEARAKLQANLALQASLQEMVRLEKRGTEAAAQRNQVQLAGVAGIDAVTKANERAASKQEQMNKALGDYRKSISDVRAANPDSILLDPKKIASAEAGIREQYKETAKAKKTASLAGESEAASIRAKAEATRDYLKGLQENGLAAKEQNEAEARASKLQEELEGGIHGVARANKEKALTAALAWAEDLKAVAATEALLKAQRDFEKDRDKEISGQEVSILKMEEKALAMEDEVRMYGMGKEAIEALSIARLQERIDILAGFEGSAAQILLIEKEIDARQRLAVATDAKTGLDAGVKAAKEADAEWKKTADSINTTLTDALMRAFEGGKSFAQAARDTIVNMFKTMVLRPVISAVMSPASAAIGSALGMNGAANAATGGSGIMSSLSSLGTLSTLGSAIGTGIAGAVGSSVSAVFGTMAGNAAIGTTLGLGTSSSLAAASAASVAGGGAAAGAGLTGTMSVLGAIPGWGWAAMAAIAVAGIFGGRGKKEATGGGIEGNFSGAGFEGNNFSTWKQKGGWFHNDRTGKNTSALDAATAKQFGDAYGAVRMSATQAAASLGLSADAITNYSQSISLQLGTDAAANEKAVAALFAGIGDNMALSAAPGIALLSKEGEAAGETMARLSTSITTANAWLSILRQRLFQVSLAGGDAASKLADAFGGLENLSAASKSFYETYYTEGERAARSQEDMTKALATLNLAMPTSKDGLRELAGSLDLNTEAGRTAYAVLLTIAPEFAAAADLASKFSQEMAAKLVKTFTGNGQLVPALDVAALKTVLLSDALVSTYAVAGNISLLFLDVNSGLLTFGDRTSTLTGGLTGAQLAALALTGQIDALHQGADRTRIDFVGLTAALEGVDTETFANTVALVFESLAARIGGVIDSIGAERIAVREAALQIIDPTVMGKDAIVRAIGAINVNAPNNSALIAAQQALGNADAYVAAQKSGIDYARSLAPSRAAMDAAAAAVAAAPLPSRDPYEIAASGFYYTNGDVPTEGWMETSPASFDQAGYDAAVIAASAPARAAYDVQVAAYGNAAAVNAAQIATAQASLSAAAAAQAAAVTAARNAQTTYIASLQNFSIDASKAVGKLGKLREETVKYYDAQKQLADLMGTSAAGLRTTVADYRYSQLSDAQQFDKLQADFAKNYAMGLSTSGETLAGYGDKLNAGLNPLLEKAKEVLTGSAYDAFAATALARAETIAGRLETLTPTDYAADSLAMLGQIDATLAALDASSKSAEKIISDAVTAGADKTANGLRAVIAALTGQAIPAFATGGMHMGGARLVGEYGPEIEVTGPSRIYSAAQTRSMLGGGNSNTARLEALVERQAQQLENLGAELRAIAISNAKIQRLADREESEGKLVRNDADTPLFIKVVV